MDEPEKQLRLVGRLQSIEDSLRSAMVECRSGDMHAIDLLSIARDATHKAVMRVWGSVPELKQAGGVDANTGN
jgi:hypothetical protein